MNFLWYDLETYGIDPKQDRIAQFAAIRTDKELNIISEEYSIFSEIPDDYLPDPTACLVHGFTPSNLSDKQLKECIFATKISDLLKPPGTCAVGFNNNYFDDEFIRFLFYRNLLDPYTWHWKNGNTRWDILNLARLITAIRPNSIKVKRTETGYSYKLQDLAASNGVESVSAHNALSDVKTTLGLAQIYRRNANDIFNHCLKMRDKIAATQFIKRNRFSPIIYTSGFIPTTMKSTTIITPICSHPSYRDCYIAIDMRHDIGTLIKKSAAELKEDIFTRNNGRGYPLSRPRVHVIKMNSCPYMCDIELALEHSIKEIGFSTNELHSRVETIRENEDVIINKIQCIFSGNPMKKPGSDVETQLYDNFLGDEDRAKCEYFLSQLQEGVIKSTSIFNDSRLKQLAWRYLHRNHPEKRSSLESEEQWNNFVQKRLTTIPEGEDKTYIEENISKIKKSQKNLGLTSRDEKVLNELEERINLLQAKYL